MMHIMFVLTMLSLLLSEPALAGEKSTWTTTDTALQSTFVLLTFIDWKQTREFTGNPHKYPDYYETNPVLGKHPSARKVNSVMAASIIGHTAIAFLLPQPFRSIWQTVWIVAEIDCIRTNYKLGISLRF